MKRIEIEAAETRTGSHYPAPFHESVKDRVRRRLGLAAGLTQFGVNLLTLRPGVWSSQRHWHSRDEEFVFVVSGELTLVTDAGEEVLRAGDCAGFKAGEPDGHQLINRSDQDAVVLEIGTDHADDVCTYSDIDMIASPTGYARKDGTLYPPRTS
jgi:uncharacterized cupin superfamily protein